MTVRVKNSSLLLLLLSACVKPSYHVPMKLEKALSEAGCQPETDFYKGDRIYPPIYATSFLSVAGVTVRSAVARCKKADGLYFLFVVEPAAKADFTCEKLVKYPFPQATGGMAILKHKFSGSIFKPIGDAPALTDAEIETNLFGLREDADDEFTGLSLACIAGHWYKAELD